MEDINKYIVKGTNYYYTRLTRIASVSLALKLRNTKILPEQLVIIGLLLGIGGVYLYSLGTYPAILFASFLYILAWFIDFVDGDLARITNRVSQRGEWLDSISGRILEMAIYLGVCWGLWRVTNSNKIWILGFVVIALHHIIVSIMFKEAIMELKLQKNNPAKQEVSLLDKKRKIGMLKIILREFTAGPDLNGVFIIVGGISNTLMLSIILCLIYNLVYLSLRLFTGGRSYFSKSAIS